ncbi:hypothetical protein N7510_007199 [Penicillium lagena]|uniref:uncharacterized protein n=1 Tax=Penicillium lagena TaxID=94218 RepID=UPI0025424797|nr:uncharacterized protein N7510_007199 [Penicillium lagena]KAJ5610480.1 hypothetical protein N7510_007199 [Penicillium lagena]
MSESLRPTNGAKPSNSNQRRTPTHSLPSGAQNGLPVRSRASVNGNGQVDSDSLSDSASSTDSSQVNGAGKSHRPAMSRKASSPMAPAFMVSAPGKAIVFGEHAVVHGKAAMAAAISLRSYLHVTTLSKSQRTVTLNFRDIGLDHTWDIDALPWDLFHQPSKKKYYYDLVTSLDPELVAAIQPHLEGVGKGMSEEIHKHQVGGAFAFLYLFLSLGSPQSPGAVYTLRSTIPTGAGLGSSASVCVCLSSALLLQIRTLAGPHPDQPPEEAETQIERINRWAFVGEMCIHGNPSGVDNTVAAGGKAVMFRRVDYNKPPEVTPLLNFPELPLLLVDTQQSRSTKTEVDKVFRLRESHPVVTESILNAIDQVSTSAQELVDDPEFESSPGKDLAQLGTLIRMNHGCLVSLGVSHPRLERIRELVDYADIGWTKLTGAGGGGCAITLLRPDAKKEVVRDLEKKLSSEGFIKYETVLGGDGVGVLWPAVLRNGSDEEGGEEIDQQKFENAVGPEGIERLVGVGMHERREGWKFWKRAAQA